MCNLVLFFILFLFNKFNVSVGFYYKFYVFLYYKFILIEEFIKYNQVNYLYCDVRYFDFHFSLGFLNFFLLLMIFIIILHSGYWVV